MPRAIDTNVLLRLLIDDGSQHHVRAIDLLGTDLFVPITVVLETEWVIRKTYKTSSVQIESLFRGLLTFPGVVVSDRVALERALDLLAAKLDFADALHLALSASSSAMLTFDKAFIPRAAASSDLPHVCEP